jgi:hypothetical protein
MPTPPAINANALIPYVGMYSIPARLLGEVVKRGCNCVFHSETDDGRVNQADWRSACRETGLGYFDFPSADLDADADDPFLLGWIIKDSDEWNRKRGVSSVLTDPAGVHCRSEPVTGVQRVARRGGQTVGARVRQRRRPVGHDRDL